jgi:hypothetical protein
MENDGAPGVKPRGNLVSSIFDYSVKFKGGMEDKVVLVKDFVVSVVKGRGFTEGLLASGDLRGCAILSMMGVVVQFPNLRNVLPKEGGY